MSLNTLIVVIYSTVSLYVTSVTGKIKLSHNNRGSVYDIKGVLVNFFYVLLVQIMWRIVEKLVTK